jgi:hypothetical protein
VGRGAKGLPLAPARRIVGGARDVRKPGGQRDEIAGRTMKIAMRLPIAAFLGR